MPIPNNLCLYNSHACINIIYSQQSCYSIFTSITPKISSHELISKHKQFILNHLQNTFSHQENHVTIHVNSETLGLLFTTTKFGIFSTRFKGFETEFTAKSSLRISLTINMALSQRINQVGKDPYLLELSELSQIGVHA